jgi:hypothetical protein
LHSLTDAESSINSNRAVLFIEQKKERQSTPKKGKRKAKKTITGQIENGKKRALKAALPHQVDRNDVRKN